MRIIPLRLPSPIVATVSAVSSSDASIVSAFKPRSSDDLESSCGPALAESYRSAVIVAEDEVIKVGRHGVLACSIANDVSHLRGVRRDGPCLCIKKWVEIVCSSLLQPGSS